MPSEDLAKPLALTRRLRELRADVVHINQAAPVPILASRLIRPAATVVTDHNPALERKYNLRGRMLSTAVRNRPDVWITLSERNRELLVRAGVDSRLISVVPPGLPADRFETPATRLAARELIGVPSGGFIVGTAGRLARQKRHDVLIRAVSSLTDLIPTIHLVVMGDGELRDETELLARQLLPGRITFSGHRKDVPSILTALDVFALSSDFEGLPFALLEAMATGLAIVSTDVQGAGEAIRDSEEGLLVPPNDPASLARAIARLAESRGLAEQLGGRARLRFLQEYTAPLMVKRTDAIFVKVLSDKARRSSIQVE